MICMCARPSSQLLQRAGSDVSLRVESPFEKISKALESLRTPTAFSVKQEAGVLVVPIRHHPTDQATLAAARSAHRVAIVVLFQPHRYSRTKDQMEEFARSFNNADVLFVTDIYAASEDPIEGITAEALTDAIKRYGHKNAEYIGPLEGAPEILRDQLQPGDMFITLGRARSIARNNCSIASRTSDVTASKSNKGSGQKKWTDYRLSRLRNQTAEKSECFFSYPLSVILYFFCEH